MRNGNGKTVLWAASVLLSGAAGVAGGGYFFGGQSRGLSDHIADAQLHGTPQETATIVDDRVAMRLRPIEAELLRISTRLDRISALEVELRRISDRTVYIEAKLDQK
jgi:hypothetical protein